MAANLTYYGTTDSWMLQPESVSATVDDRGVWSSQATYKTMSAIGSVPAFPAEVALGAAFPMNGDYNCDCFCNKRTIQGGIGFTTVTGSYVGLGNVGGGSSTSQSEVRTEWICNTQASPIQTHPDFEDKLKQYAVMDEDDLFVDFPASAPKGLGGITDFLEPAATLRVSWVEKTSQAKGTISKYTKQIGKISDPPKFAEFDLPTGNRNFLLNSFDFSFYAKGAGEEAKWAELSLDFMLSQADGWNEDIYKEASGITNGN